MDANVRSTRWGDGELDVAGLAQPAMNAAITNTILLRSHRMFEWRREYHENLDPAARARHVVTQLVTLE
jgi:hypothetical protein